MAVHCGRMYTCPDCVIDVTYTKGQRCISKACYMAPAYDRFSFSGATEETTESSCERSLVGCVEQWAGRCAGFMGDGKIYPCDNEEPSCGLSPLKIEAAKASNPQSTQNGGEKFDSDKLRFDLVPPIAVKALATILTMGADKYSANNWQQLTDFTPRFSAALMRHFNAWRSGEKDDPESGKPHLWHVLCNVAFLIWKEGA